MKCASTARHSRAACTSTAFNHGAMRRRRSYCLFGDGGVTQGSAKGSSLFSGRAAESLSDFIRKLGIVMKELNESRVWLEMIRGVKHVAKSDDITLLRHTPPGLPLPLVVENTCSGLRECGDRPVSRISLKDPLRSWRRQIQAFDPSRIPREDRYHSRMNEIRQPLNQTP